MKLAVTGCPRNCAEAYVKDLGVVAIDGGKWEIYVGGAAGAHVRKGDLLATVATPATFLQASSTLALSGTLRPPRRPSSAVTMTVDLQSSSRPAIESGEKPPKITECTAPIRAQARIEIAASGIIGM